MSKTDRFFEEHWWARFGAAALLVGALWAAYEVGESRLRDDADETRRGAFFDVGGKGYEVNT